MPQNAIKSAAGPICKSVDDVAAYFRMLWSPTLFSSNFQVPPMPFNENAFQNTKTRKLTFGYVCYTKDGKLIDGVESLPLSKASTRAMIEVRQRLEAQGHKVVPFQINLEQIDEMLAVYSGFIAMNVMP